MASNKDREPIATVKFIYGGQVDTYDLSPESCGYDYATWSALSERGQYDAIYLSSMHTLANLVRNARLTSKERDNARFVRIR